MGDDRFDVSAESLTRAALGAGPGTAQLVVVHRSEVVVDETVTPEPVDVYAVQKGVVSVLFGMAEERGLLRSSDPVSELLGVGWTQLAPSVEAQLRIGMVLDMTTGMDDELRSLGEVGVTWRYNNVAYNYLKTALEVATGMALGEVSRAWLFDPLGMRSTSWVDRPVLRPDGRPITAMTSTARDLAEFGAMILSGGGGLVDPGFVGTLGRPGSRENPAWGRCWWNNNQPHHRLPRRESDVVEGSVTPTGPADMVAARGAFENRLCIVPSLDLVVARTARPAEPGGSTSFDHRFWKAIRREPADRRSH